MLEKFIESLPKNVDGALIVSPENRRYFTGFDASDGYLFATKNGYRDEKGMPLFH